MFAAYLYHIVNFVLSIGLLVLLLSKLPVSDYAYWIAFSTIGGFGLQLQNAIQNVVVREISLEHEGPGVGASWYRARRLYRRLTALVGGPLFVGGGIYLWSIGARAAVLAAWAIQVMSYALVYWFGPRNALLLGTEKLNVNSNLSTVARLVYVFAAILLVTSGFGLFGMVLAFAASSVVSVALAHRSTMRFRIAAADTAFNPGSVTRFALFSLSSFALYNGGVLAGFHIATARDMAGYGLAIQVATLLTAIATVPTQAWLGRLSATIVARDGVGGRKQIRRSMAAGNFLFISGFVGFLWLGPVILTLIGGRVDLPAWPTMILISAAYLVELNILLLSLFLLSFRQYRFTTIYFSLASAGLAGGIAMALFQGGLNWLIALPLVIQSVITLPIIRWLLARSLAMMNEKLDVELSEAAKTALRANRAEANVDQIVYERFFQGRVGVFLDIGAARPDFLSMSATYRLKGWHVVALEPNPAYKQRYAELGITVLPFAISEVEQDDVEFTVVESMGTKYNGGHLRYESFSSLSIKECYDTTGYKLKTSKIKVKTRRIDTIIGRYLGGRDRIDIISVDIEGWELEALSSMDFKRFSPDVLIVENLFFSAEYHRFMEDRGYILWRCIAPNDIYVRRDLVSSSSERLLSRVQTMSATVVGRVRRLGGRTLRRLR